MTSPQRPEPPAATRAPLRRGGAGSQLAGVSQGLGDHLGLHPFAIRVLFVALTALGGAGALIYAFLWATIEPVDQQDAASTLGRWASPGKLLVAGGGAVVLLGIMGILQAQGLNLRLDVTIPVLVLTVGAVFIWAQLDPSGRERLLGDDGGSRQKSLGRLVIGAGLAVVGLVALTTQNADLGQMRNVAAAVVVALIGVGLLAAPYVTRLWRNLREEQAATARATERADIAAHLHDSVLQTLALIQRRADDPTQVARLARAQERELRSWLYAGPVGPAATLAGAVAAAGHDVEDLHGVPIEVIITGDRPLDSDGQALVNALREAMLNAVRHGEPPVSAYVEVGAASVEAFVRDHGAGFELEGVPSDRLGVRESIMGRMHRHGGTARVRRLEHGTEVSLELPLSPEPQGAES
ncbi:PspC domain-containing protein [Ornithinimicrobium faecis]|uniref:PspC domain-containing protein n=1 Tax=Ornithinimicrobium faecis TaxID=2934158 RepID=A0ABY4YW17_9MICO|nr:ATP-binding protein [Ornithinimicrobium sp. HY1793]USQ80568.1 PspC domain-containing protein [Ornithinimicrobium sp. HY1793]